MSSKQIKQEPRKLSLEENLAGFLDEEDNSSAEVGSPNEGSPTQSIPDSGKSFEELFAGLVDDLEPVPQISPTLNRHNDPPENASTGEPLKSPEDSDDFCYADIVADNSQSTESVRGISPDDTETLLAEADILLSMANDMLEQDDIQEVDDSDTISVEVLLFMNIIGDFRKNLAYIYARLGDWLSDSELPKADYIGIAKALLGEHKSLVDSLIKQSSLREKTNQLLSGVVNPPKEAGDSKP